MPQNLKDHATAQVTRYNARVDAARQALSDAQEELGARGDAAAVPPDGWRGALGAEQYLQEATRELDRARAEEAGVRSRAATATPEEMDQIEDDLRDALVDIGQATVRVRDARERLERARLARDRAGTAVATATERLAAATAWETEAARRQARHETWRAAFGSAPLDTVVADAGALLAATDVTAARDRLQELLPATLFDRADARHGEARDLVAAAEAAAAAAAGVLDGVRTDRAAVDGGVAAARRRLAAAEGAVAAYVGRAATAADRARAALAPIPDLEDLTAQQAEALDDANPDNDDAKQAATDEAALAAALATLRARQQDVDDATLAALAEDPDRDPTTVAAVQAAIAARDDAAVQDPLSTARSAYDDAAQRALSSWEVEVPPAIWTAAAAFFRVVAELTDLTDQAARDALEGELDDAVDALVDALDGAALADRAAEDVTDLTRARADEVEVLRRTARARTFDYVRGAGPGGRTPLEV